jgi:hypothetical protein
MFRISFLVVKHNVGNGKLSSKEKEKCAVMDVPVSL